MARFLTSKQEEFERVAMPHTRSLLRVARRLTPEADDLVQEAMLLAWRGFSGFKDGTNIRAWLFRIMINAFHTAGRKAIPAALPIDGRDFAYRPQAEDATEVARALDELPPEHRAVLLLGVVEGFTCQEMSEILSVPIGTVMSRISRAREAMRVRLAPKCAAKGAS